MNEFFPPLTTFFVLLLTKSLRFFFGVLTKRNRSVFVFDKSFQIAFCFVMVAFSFVLFLFEIFFAFALNENEHLREIAFKFWLKSGTEQCFHELLQSGSTLYFIYEILNADNDRTHITTYLRQAENEKLVGLSQTFDRGHLDFIANETSRKEKKPAEERVVFFAFLRLALIDICLDHPFTRSPAKFLSIYIHIYHHERILMHYERMEIVDNISLSVRV